MTALASYALCRLILCGGTADPLQPHLADPAMRDRYPDNGQLTVASAHPNVGVDEV